MHESCLKAIQEHLGGSKKARGKQSYERFEDPRGSSPKTGFAHEQGHALEGFKAPPLDAG